ncbi:probable insulin-like peptide 7 [Aethina tumida]|uniref:probable insulin-like peptide 7 n=1 Tax=Aethina tumida TaxID=116153 RepID=UPI002147C59C|nr:probable insulin-like peptide 7 [Aethina tumida]XP_049821279.1 probable insulin-like peptide 7 [Aethina tumida]XP_049821280.1 probable insulin-like peptide 7 [Aethina tumida]
MKFPVSTIATLWLLLDITDGAMPDRELDLIFRDRSKTDWQNAWHKEKHARCRERLIGHLYWACEKDIYKLTRRTDPTFKNYFMESDELNYPWLIPSKAKSLLQFKRGIKRSGSSITSECCMSTGCTWEEYAEYCPNNKRHTLYSSY